MDTGVAVPRLKAIMMNWIPRALIAIAALVCTLVCSAGTLSANENTQWIWKEGQSGPGKLWFRKTFSIDEDLKSARLVGTADNHVIIWINGEQVLKGDNWQELPSSDVLKVIRKGENVIAVEAVNDDGVGALLACLRLVKSDGTVIDIPTDASWKVTDKKTENWQRPDFDASSWSNVKVAGPVGGKGLPWTREVTATVFAEELSGTESNVFQPVVAPNVAPREGFVVEVLFDVPRSMGSWVSLTEDDKGRLIASAQGGEGLFLIHPAKDGQPTKVERLNVKLSGAQGLCWAFDSLYVMINGGSKSGLHRVRDTDGDGLVDTSEHLMPLPGGGEHGPHAVILAPDGKSLYVVAGNHTKLPDGITGSRIPMNWGEDHLLPRRWDANGHAAGILAPGGWILKIDPDAKEREVISMGYRNPYDIVFNADGELFTYDADMEWDLGAPWYRPTRVNHATSGSEFGWRSGTGKWPSYYEDSLPAVVDIGPGSPVGVLFGYGAKFPAKYQKALFLLDWTYSTIYAVHLTPDGSTYSGVKEDFLVGDPMQVTDGVIAKDGSFCFAAGGRGTKSALYRVRYTGNEPTDPVNAHDADGVDSRALRHKLEAYHGKVGADLDFVFAHLGHEDRFIRYAARIALESQPVDQWRARALSGTGLNPRGAIVALIALARQGKPEDLDGVLKGLNRINFEQLDEQAQLAWLRAYELAFIRLGAPNEEQRQASIEKLSPLYPAKVFDLNAELVQLLVYLNAPEVVSRTIALMENLGPEPIPDWGYLVTRSDRYGGTVGKLLEKTPPARAIHLAFVLRNQKDGWTLEDRKKYFQFWVDASKFPGGNSFGKFLSQFRDDAILNCPPSDQVALGELLSVSLLAPPPATTPPKGPGRKWTREDALKEIDGKLKGRNFDSGRNLFFAVSCGKCHRLNGEGGAIGPDLSTAGKKFPLPDLLDSILEPSKVISDQYASHVVATADGEVLQGRAVEIGDELYIFTSDADAPPRIIKKTDVEEIRPSQISQMPVGLVDPLSPEELRDLMAYLISGGDPRSAFFKK